MSVNAKLASMVLALVALVSLAACGDDGGGTVEASSSTTGLTTTTAPTTSNPPTTVAPPPTAVDDVGTQPGIEEFTAQCREGDPEGCRQLLDTTLQEICDEGQTIACQVRGARVGEGDPDGDGTEPFEEGCRAGEFEDCAELSDATLQAICDEGQTAACQTYLARTGEGGE